MSYTGIVDLVDLPAAIIQPLPLSSSEKQITIDVLRLDRIDPLISGNKWFKLAPYLEAALQKPGTGLLSFGGAWSNHLLALAAACRRKGIPGMAILRGEEPQTPGATIRQLREMGMKLIFLPRHTFAGVAGENQLSYWEEQYPGYLAIPEGGAGKGGVAGASQIAGLFAGRSYSHVLCASGTGTTLLGLLRGTPPETRVLGIWVLKGMQQPSPASVYTELGREERERLHFVDDYHFGGYARKTDELTGFMNQFYSRFGVPTDFVYTGKLFYAVEQLVGRHYFPPGSRLLVVHSGGLQGNRSLEPGRLIF